MNLWEQRKQNQRATRDAANQQVRAALQFDIGKKPAPDVRDSRHAYVKAIELAGDLFERFTLPMKPRFYALGIMKDASNRRGAVSDGIIKLGATIQTLTGHKTEIEVPVVVQGSRLLEPSVFYLDGAPYIICQATMDQLVKAGTLSKGIGDRKLYQPPLMDKPMHNDTRQPIINREHMFSPGTRSPWNMRRSQRQVQADALLSALEPLRTEIHEAGEHYPEWKMLDDALNVGNSAIVYDVLAPLMDKIRDAANTDTQWEAVENAVMSIQSTEHVAQRDTPRPRVNIDEESAKTMTWRNEVPDEYLDPAERTHEGLHSMGDTVKLTEDFEVRERGGAHLILPKGEKGEVLRDTAGDGKMLLVRFESMDCMAVIPRHFLSGGGSKQASAPTVEQVRHEIQAMLREGYGEVDIREAIARKYPEQAGEALQVL